MELQANCSINYEATGANGGPLFQAIKFINSPKKQRTLTVLTNSNRDQGSYTVEITATTNCPTDATYLMCSKKVIKKKTVRIIIVPGNKAPPYFITELKNLTVQANTHQTFTLPMIKDIDEDQPKIIVFLYNTTSFVKYSNFKFTFSANDLDNGNYTVDIILQD
jgi:hypothetical protein